MRCVCYVTAYLYGGCGILDEYDYYGRDEQHHNEYGDAYCLLAIRLDQRLVHVLPAESRM